VSGTVAMDWEAWSVAAAKLNLHLDMNYNSKQYLALPNEAQGFGFDYRHVGTPRMYGFDAHYHF
jgi:hypothetical protein